MKIVYVGAINDRRSVW